MTERLGSAWSVSEARSVVARLRHVATTGPEYDAVELFLALCDYLDQLHGPRGSTGSCPRRSGRRWPASSSTFAGRSPYRRRTASGSCSR